MPRKETKKPAEWKGWLAARDSCFRPVFFCIMVQMEYHERNALGRQSDRELLAQCEVDLYRASGPGGQKRNKTDSAVRLRHPPTGLIVIAEESRSQHDNRAKALERLRQAFALKIRVELAREQLAASDFPGLDLIRGAIDASGKLHLGRKDPRFWEVVAVALDVLHATSGRVSEAAEILGLTTGNLISLLETSPKVWEQVNHLRKEYGHKPLRVS
jgi:hypothetical protein